jgi:hypothetical protein
MGQNLFPSIADPSGFGTRRPVSGFDPGSLNGHSPTSGRFRLDYTFGTKKRGRPTSRLAAPVGVKQVQWLMVGTRFVSVPDCRCCPGPESAMCTAWMYSGCLAANCCLPESDQRPGKSSGRDLGIGEAAGVGTAVRKLPDGIAIVIRHIDRVEVVGGTGASRVGPAEGRCQEGTASPAR